MSRLGLVGILFLASLLTTVLSFAIDPLTRVSPNHAGSFAPGLMLTGLGLLLLGWCTCRREGEAGITLRHLVAPVILPVAAFHLVALVLHPQFDSLLEIGLGLFAPDRLRYRGVCVISLSPCAYVLAYEPLRALVLGVEVVALALSIRAGRAAWRLGLDGRRVSTSGTIAATACFALGLVAFFATRGLDRDRRLATPVCESKDRFTPAVPHSIPRRTP